MQMNNFSNLPGAGMVKKKNNTTNGQKNNFTEQIGLRKSINRFIQKN
jgi:hypothetical protein